FLEIAHAPTNFPLVHSSCRRNSSTILRATDPISIVIALNKESLILDPIDWPVLKNELLEWAQRYCPELTINDETDNLVRERALPAHRARVGPSHPPKPVGPYRFFCQ